MRLAAEVRVRARPQGGAETVMTRGRDLEVHVHVDRRECSEAHVHGPLHSNLLAIPPGRFDAP